VVEQAGGAVLELDGNPLSYNNKADILNPHFLVAGPMDHNWLEIIGNND
jgi:3'(2'), 5'-bisphosphate nucleotidase